MEEKRLKDYLNLLTESGLLTENNLGSSHEEKNVRYVSYNSMDVKPGTLFICKGKAFKAQYLQDAIDKGAFCYVGETKIEGIEKDFPYILVNDIRTAMSEIGGLFYDEIWNIFDYIKKAFYLELAINRPYIFGGRYTVLYGKFFCAQFIVDIGIVLAVVVAHNIRVVALIHSQNPIFMKAFGTGKLRQFKRKPHLFTKDLNLNNSVNLYPV